MKDMSDQKFCENELAFFGTITASVSHELNNVLSIINEYSGLLSDLLIAAEKGNDVDNDKLLKIVKNIEDQVKREKSIIKLLNRFAHRVDTPLREFDLNELLNDITRLSKRFASLKKVELEIALPQKQIMITNNPFAVQHIIFLCLKLALESSNLKDTISIILEEGESQAIININSPFIDKSKTSDEMFDLIFLLMNNVQGDIIQSEPGDNRHLIKLIIPFSVIDNIKEL